MVFAARALAARGHHVDVYTRCEEPGLYDEVTYHDIGELDRAAQLRDWDAFVSLRFPDILERDVRAAVRILWCQDVLRGAPLDAWHAWTDRFVFVSEWHRRTTEGFYPGLHDAAVVIENSIPLDLIPKLRSDRDPPLLVHLSRPERGLGPLLDAWPSIRARVPEAQLAVGRYRSFHEPAGSQTEAMCLRMDERVRTTPGAFHLGHLSKPQLYEVLSNATAMVYPAAFDETSCIAAIEAQACGTPIVAVARGALPETIHPEAGILLGQGPRWLERFADAVADLIYDPDRRAAMSEAGRRNAGRFDAARIAARWEEEIVACVEQRASKHAPMIARTLAQRGDSEAAGTTLPSAYGPAVAAWPGWGPGLVASVRAMVGQACTLAIVGDAELARQIFASGPHAVEARSPSQPPGPVVDALVDIGGLLCAEDRAAWLAWTSGQVRPGGLVVHVLPSARIYPDQRVNPTYADVVDWFGDAADITCTAEAAAQWGVPARCWIVRRFSAAQTGRDRPERKRLFTRAVPTVSACLIVRDAADTVLTTLESLRCIADEIRIVDTGSIDATATLVEDFARRVPTPVHLTHAAWPGEFAAARNLSIQDAEGDWVLWIDADERLIGGERLRRLLQTEHFNAYAIRQHNHIFDAGHTQVEIPFRVFRNHQGYRFFGAVHEHPERTLNEVIEPWILAPGVDILHYGYLTEPTRTRKLLKRNLALLNEDIVRYPGRDLTDVLYLRDCVNLARFDMRAGLPIRDDHLHALEVGVARFEEKCMPSHGRFYHLGRTYYDQALGLLGQGAEIVIQVGRDNAEKKVHRFRRAEDAVYLATEAARRHVYETIGGPQ